MGTQGHRASPEVSEQAGGVRKAGQVGGVAAPGAGGGVTQLAVLGAQFSVLGTC